MIYNERHSGSDSNFIYDYSQTCIKWLPLGQRKSGLLRQITS
jgi:hypothetical protein